MQDSWLENCRACGAATVGGASITSAGHKLEKHPSSREPTLVFVSTKCLYSCINNIRNDSDLSQSKHQAVGQQPRFTATSDDFEGSWIARQSVR